MQLYPQYPNQPWPGYVPSDALNPAGGTTGEINPTIRRSINMQYGRQLAGLGASEGHPGDSSYEDDTLSRLETDDDVVGSGVFDAPGWSATVHPTLGVFQDHPNVPGYIDREIPFRASKEVESIPGGAQVVVVPGGGMTYGGRLLGGGVSPPLTPRFPTGGGARPAPRSSVPRPVGKVGTAEAAPMGRAPVVSVPAAAKAGDVRRPLTKALLPAARLATAMAPTPVFHPAAAVARRPAPVAPRPPTVTLAPRVIQRATSGFGDDPPAPSIMPYLVGGALLGASVAVFKALVYDKKK